MRRTRIALIAAIVLLSALAVVALPRVLDVNRYRDTLQGALAERLHREVLLGDMRLELFPPALRVENAAITDDPAFQSVRPFAQIEEVRVTLRPLPLLLGRLELRSVELRRPTLELVRSSSGAWNFATLGRGGSGGGLSAPNRIVVVDGRLAIARLDACCPGLRPEGYGEHGRTVYRDVDLQIDGYTPGAGFDLALTATPGADTGRLTIRGTAGPLDDEWAMTPFEGVVQSDRLSLAGLPPFPVPMLEGSDALISGTVNLRSRDGRVSANGSLRLAETRVHGVDLGYPVTADFDLVHDVSTRTLTIASGSLLLDRTPISAAGTVDLQSDPATLNVRLTSYDVSLSEAARLASALGVAFSADTRVQGRLNADVQARGPVQRPAVDGRVQLRDVTISGPDLPQPVRTQAVDLVLTPDEIRSNEFAASTNGTSLAVRFAMSEYTSSERRVDVGVRTTRAGVGELLKIARAWGVRAVDDVSGTGLVTLNVRASGPTDSLVYSGSGSIEDAVLTTPSLARPLRLQSALAFAKDAVRFERLRASIGKTNLEGSLTLGSFAAPKAEFQLAADKIDVADLQNVLAPVRKLADRPRQEPGGSLLLRTVGSGRMRVGSLTYGSLVLDNVQTVASIDHGLIRLEPLTAGLYGGRHRGAIVLDARRGTSTISVDSDLQQVDANRLATAVANLHDVVHGRLASGVRVQFVTDGAERMTRSLNGTMSLDLPNGRIAGMDLLHEVATIARFVTGTRRIGATPVTGLKGNFEVTDGVAHTNDLVASIEGGRIGATGSVNLVTKGLNLRVVAVLSREFSRRVGGTGVGGFMATALANRQGELVVPLLLTGTFERPHFEPDLERVVEMRIANLVPSFTNPHRLAAEIFRGSRGGKSEDTNPDRMFEEMLGIIFGSERSPAPEGETEGTEQVPDTPRSTPEAGTKTPADELQRALEELLRPLRPDEKRPPPEEKRSPR